MNRQPNYLNLIGRQKMSKKIFSMLLAVVVMLSFTFYYFRVALAQTKPEAEQYGQVKGEAAPQTGEAGPLKENICINPKLCDSLEIDLLTNLNQAKVPVLLPDTTAGKTDKDYQAALNFGAVVADALASIAKKDKESFQKYAGQAQELGKQLGISEALMGRCQKITAMAEKKQWDKLGLSLYEFKDGVINELNEKNKKGLAALAMISGGLEGFYIAAQSVNGKYSDKGAKLLDNQDLISYFKSYGEDLSPELKQEAGIKALSDGIPDLEKAMNELRANNYQQAEVKKIYDMTGTMRKNLLAL